VAKIEVYKRGQGRYTRIITFLSVMVIGVIGAFVLSDVPSVVSMPIVQFGVPTAVVLALALLMFWIVNRPKSADFLIATESEMKKVSWSSRKEVVGSTKVVIVTTLILAALLFSVDILFKMLFSVLGIWDLKS